MAKVNVTPTANSATSDQDWIVDVTRILKEHLNWNGVSLTVEANTIVLSSNTPRGIKVDTVSPTYPWVDLLGEINLDATGGPNRPDWNKYKGNIYQWQMAVDDQVYNNFHIPHDYVPGSDIYVHVHWSANTVVSNTAGAPTFTMEATYAKGHGQMNFSNNVTVTVSNTYIAAYRHMISETALSANNGAGGLLRSNDIETDGIIIIRTKLTQNSMVTEPFIHYVDIHYQSTGIGTKNKAPSFYT